MRAQGAMGLMATVAGMTMGIPSQADAGPPQTMQQHIQRLDDIAKSRYQEFDSNHDGGLELSEFIDAAWSSLTIYVAPGGRLDEIAFLQAFLGPIHDKGSPALHGARADNYRKVFTGLDKGKKGFLTKDDIVEWQSRSFREADRNHDGIVTQTERQPR